MFGSEIGSLEKSHGIGQTPCSYERYLVKHMFALYGQLHFYIVGFVSINSQLPKCTENRMQRGRGLTLEEVG